MKILTLGLFLLKGVLLFGIFRKQSQIAGFDDLRSQKVKVGIFTKQIYTAKWTSTREDQFDFVKSKTGNAYLSIGYNSTETDFLIYRFKLLEEFLCPNRYLISESKFDLEKPEQTELVDKNEKEVVKIFEFKNTEQIINCTFNSVYSIFDSEGNKLPITTDHRKNILIKANIKSENCKIEASAEFRPNEIDYFQSTIFMLVEGITTFFSGISFLKDARFDSIENSHFLGSNNLILNIAADFGILFANMFIGNQMLIGYQSIFLVLTFLKMLNIFNKMRSFIQNSEMEAPVRENDQQQVLFNFFKIFTVMFIFFYFAIEMVVNFWIWVPILTYPLFQIYHNCFYVSRKNCFRFHVHFCMYVGQVTYLIWIHISEKLFFRLNESQGFCLAIFLNALGMVSIMFLQSKWGNIFFFPNFLKEKYRLYKKHKTDALLIGKDCCICLVELSTEPEIQEDSSNLKPVKTSHALETPCKHLFHETCLKKWMDQKMLCPICRSRLPPNYD